MIRLIKKIAFLAWILFVLFVGAWIGLENSQSITPTFLGYRLWSWSFGVYFSVTLLIGVILGFVTSFFLMQGKVFRKNRELSKTRKQVESLQLEHTRNK